jgi:hypothetical protein
VNVRQLGRFELGHFRKFGLVTEMSGLPSEADIVR